VAEQQFKMGDDDSDDDEDVEVEFLRRGDIGKMKYAFQGQQP